jgi:hypothetical protein
MATLETPRLLLRPFRDTDLDVYAAIHADPRGDAISPATASR